MGMVHKGGNAVPFHGDHHPVSIYVGDQPIFEPIDKAQDGKTLTFENTYNDAAEVTVFGESVQETLTGKNLLDSENAGDWDSINKWGDVAKNENSFVLTSGKNGATLYFYENITFVGGQSYTVSFDASSSVDNLIFDYHYLMRPNGERANYPLRKSVVLTRTTHHLSFEFTAPTNYGESFYSKFMLGTSRSSSGDIITISNIQLEKGSTDTEYEPYCGGIPAPNPDYPQPIESIKSVELVSMGRNLVNVRNGSGSKINVYYVDVPMGIQVEIGKTYTISFDSSSTVENFNTNVGFGNIYEFLKDGPYLIDQSSGRHSITFTVEASDIKRGNWLHLRPVRYSSPQTFDYSYENISVTEGSDQHPYEPYRSAMRSIDLQGHELRSLPDGTRDELVVHRDGTVELVLRCDASMFDPSHHVSNEWKLAAPQTIQLPSIDPLPTYHTYTFVDGNGADISARVRVFLVTTSKMIEDGGK